MRHNHQPTTVAILGSDTLAEGILARLLEREGYNTRILEAHPMGVVDELPEDVSLLLLTPGLKPDVRVAFVETIRSNPKTALIPALSFSAALKQALLDEPASEPILGQPPKGARWAGRSRPRKSRDEPQGAPCGGR